MNNYKSTIENAKHLKEEYPKLTDYECLHIASQIQISEAIDNGLDSGSSNQPKFIEAVAMALGYKNSQFGSRSIVEMLSEISDKLEHRNSNVEEE